MALTEPTGEYGCLKVQFTRCVIRTVDGHDVLVGYVRNKWGGGVQVFYDGPSYEIRVVFEPDQAGDEFPIDRAAAFVVDSRSGWYNLVDVAARACTFAVRRYWSASALPWPSRSR